MLQAPDEETRTNLAELVHVMEAKAARDTIRQTLVNSLLAQADASEIAALLEADRQATARLGELLREVSP